MPYVELAAAAYIGALGAFITAEGWINRIFFRAPLFPVSATLFADALSRLGYLS